MKEIKDCEDPIAYKDPRDDIFKTVNVIETEEDSLEIRLVREEKSFQEMEKTQIYVEKDEIINGIKSEKGYNCSYLGISVFLSLTLRDNNFLLTMKKPELDYTHWPVCGYVKSNQTPTLSLEEEVSEEILPVIGGDKLLMCFDFGGKHYKNKFKDHWVVPLLLDEKQAKYTPPGNLKKLVKYEDMHAEGSPHIYFDNSNNHAQVVFFRHISTGIDLTDRKVSLNYAEDEYNEKEEDISKRLYVYYHPCGVDLIRLDDGKLTDQVYNLIGGILKKVGPQEIKNIKLAEIFNIGEDCFVGERGIPLVDYVKKSFSK